MPIVSRKKEMEMEEKACSMLDLKNGHIYSLVQCTSFLLETMASETSLASTSFVALLMPRYVTTLAETAQLCEPALLVGLQHMISALEYIHSFNLVHMDIKGDNIFIDSNGSWFLGDFGSCTLEHEEITSFTRYYLPGLLYSTI